MKKELWEDLVWLTTIRELFLFDFERRVSRSCFIKNNTWVVLRREQLMRCSCPRTTHQLLLIKGIMWFSLVRMSNSWVALGQEVFTRLCWTRAAHVLFLIKKDWLAALNQQLVIARSSPRNAYSNPCVIVDSHCLTNHVHDEKLESCSRYNNASALLDYNFATHISWVVPGGQGVLSSLS